MRFLVAAFLLFWLGGWFFGFSSASSKVLSGDAPAFLFFWLGAWSVGGLFAVYTLYRIFRPPVPETLRLRATSLGYDSGIPPFTIQMSYANQKEYWKSLFPKRTVVDVDRRQVESLRLRETDSGNRLTLDAGASRISIGEAAGEIEREWLYRALSDRYRLNRS